MSDKRNRGNRMDKKITVTKAVGYVPYSQELADDYPNLVGWLADALDPTKPRPAPWVGPPITPLPELHRRLLDATVDSPLRAVVELHEPHHGYVFPDGTVNSFECYGCDTGDYADSAARWPCQTVDLLAERLGVVDVEPTHRDTAP